MPTDFISIVNLVGALAFGLVVGWVTSSTLRRSKRDALTDISTVIAAVGGAAIIALFPKETGAFGIYSIGLAIGFWWYIHQAMKPNAPDWLGEAPGTHADEARGRQLPRVGP